ncbi:MAG: hypothetical protein R2873_25550 [Caldilineaceae bacterium]
MARSKKSSLKGGMSLVSISSSVMASTPTIRIPKNTTIAAVAPRQIDRT